MELVGFTASAGIEHVHFASNRHPVGRGARTHCVHRVNLVAAQTVWLIRTSEMAFRAPLRP